MQRLIIIGAGGMGREVYDLCKAMPANGRDWQLAGFLDDREEVLAGLGSLPPIISGPFEYQPRPDDYFVCAKGESNIRLPLCEYLKASGAKFISLVPSHSLGSGTTVGEGCIFYNLAGVGPNSRVGNFVFLNAVASIGHDSVVGDGTVIGPQTCVGGRATIGRGVYIGTNATILPGAVVEDYAYVGAGSVVLRRVRTRTKVFGNPAVEIGSVEFPAPWLAGKLSRHTTDI